MLITQQIKVTATFPLHHRYQRRILHKKCHFQPFLKFKLSEKFSWSPPFAKMLKMTQFSGLENRRLRCVGSIVAGVTPLSLKYLIRSFIPYTFQGRHCRRWPASAFILYKICHFQPFLKFKLSKKFSWGPPFHKMTKMTHFSTLGNRWRRCVGSIVSGATPLSLKC